MRFLVGHKTHISEGEAQHRIDAIRRLFNKQAETSSPSPTSAWNSIALDLAKQIAKGEPPVIVPLPVETDDPVELHMRGRIYGYHVSEGAFEP